MKYLNLTTAIVAALSLSACGGGGGGGSVDAGGGGAGGGGGGGEPTGPVTYEEKQNFLTDNFNDMYLHGGLDSELPVSGQAHYAGVLSVPDPIGPGYHLMGDLDMVMTFAGSSQMVSGEVDNFTNRLDEDFSGTLAVEGLLDHFQVAGNLTSEAGDTTTYAASTGPATWAGDPDQAPEYIAGTVGGTMVGYNDIWNYADEIYVVVKD